MNESNTPRFTPQGLIPTREQTAIQLAQNKVVLVSANAGAAKTTTLAIRIGEALARKLPPEQILALVFTPEARDVMRQRLLDIGIPYATAGRIEVATFEEFAAGQLARIDGVDIKPTRQTRLLKKYALAAIEEAGVHYGGRVEYLDLRTHNIAISQFLDVQLGLKATMALDQDLEYLGVEEAASVLDVPLADYLTTIEYERIRLGGPEGTVFRGPYDATYDLARYLSQTPELAQSLPEYGVLVCDELHDLNEAAFGILNALLSRPSCYFVGAGDSDQVIHSRLGADRAFMASRFGQRYPGLKQLPLTHTYRHGPHLAYAMKELMRKEVESTLPLHTEIRQLHYDGTGATCGARVVEAVKAWKRDGYPLDGCAILIRDRHQSIAIENALNAAAIGYRTPDMSGYLQRDEILFIRGMIAIALKDLEAVKSYEVRAAIIDALAIFGEAELTPQRLEQAKHEVAKNPHLLGDFFQLYLDPAQQRPGAQAAISATVAWIKDIAPDTQASVVLQEICTRMNLAVAAKRIFVRPYDASVVARSIDGLLAAAAASGQDLQQFWQTLNAAEAFATRKRDKNAVLIECAANAKGKEFDHVILPFLETGEFPDRISDPTEERNLFYVAATRAKARLTLLSPTDAASRSVFINQMNLVRSSAAADQALAANERRTEAAPPSRHYLAVSFAEGPAAKALGAKFDWTRKAWYVEAGADLKPFAAWLK